MLQPGTHTPLSHSQALPPLCPCTLTHLRPHRLQPPLGTCRSPEVNRALGSRRGWAGIWGASVGRGSTQSPRPLLLVALHPPLDHILPLSSFLQPPLPPQMTQTGHHPLLPACFLNTESWAERNCRLAGCSPVLAHTYPSPPPAPCLTHLQLLEQQVNQDSVAEPGHSVQSTGCCFPGWLTFGGPHPGQALCQSSVGIRGTKSQGAATFSSTAGTSLPP